MGDTTDMEHATEDGPGVDATDSKEEGPGGIDTDKEPGGETTDAEGQGVNNHTRLAYLALWIPPSVSKVSPAST